LPSAAARIRRRVDSSRLPPAEEVLDEQVRFVGGERLERKGARTQLASAPTGTNLEQLGARHAGDEDRGVAAQVGHLVHEVEQARLRPVEVLEHDDERPRA